ncbi:SAF domain-containing protein [Pseudocitrobacter faecalis]|nr:SAF domain-containing protein [Pseudocitrobacter faecalis]
MRFVVDAKTAWKALGRVNYERKESEKGNVKFRRSLYVVKDVKKGEILTSENVKSIRPGYGLAPKYYDEVIGKNAAYDINFGTPLKCNMIK